MTTITDYATRANLTGRDNGDVCGNCRFWHRAGSLKDKGRCRLLPPALLGDRAAAVWPVTDANRDWCASFTRDQSDTGSD